MAAFLRDYFLNTASVYVEAQTQENKSTSLKVKLPKYFDSRIHRVCLNSVLLSCPGWSRDYSREHVPEDENEASGRWH